MAGDSYGDERRHRVGMRYSQFRDTAALRPHWQRADRSISAGRIRRAAERGCDENAACGIVAGGAN